VSPDLPAEDAHLGPVQAEELVWAWSERFHAPAQVMLWWDMPLDKQAATQRAREGFWVVFNGWGCTLALLAHELAHCVDDWDETETHGPNHDALTALIECQLRELLP
jgi:hypothetical protein